MKINQIYPEKVLILIECSCIINYRSEKEMGRNTIGKQDLKKLVKYVKQVYYIEQGLNWLKDKRVNPSHNIFSFINTLFMSFGAKNLEIVALKS